MFESAVQPRAESLDDRDAGRLQAPANEATEVDDRPAARRYSADDFRALAARLKAGTGAAKARPAAISSITLPDLMAAFKRPDSHGAPAAEQSDDQPAIVPEPGPDDIVSALEAADATPTEPAPEAIDSAAEENGVQEWHEEATLSEARDADGAAAAEPVIQPFEAGELAEPQEPDDHQAPMETASLDHDPGSMESPLAAAEAQTEPEAQDTSGSASAPAIPAAEVVDGDDHRQELHAEHPGDIERPDDAAAEQWPQDVGQTEINTGPALPDTAIDETAGSAAADSDGPRPGHEAPPAEPASDGLSGSATEPVSAPPRSASVPALRNAFEPDRQSGDTARMLLDIMAMPSGAVQPQERALAGETLLRLVSRMPVDSVISLCERLCIMETPPPLLVRRLVQHPNAEVAGPLLERCTAISDQDLMNLITAADAVRLRLIARRRHLSPALTDALIELGDSSVLLTVVRNPGAALSPEAFGILAELAKSHHGLQAPLATRADTPAPIAFELFWCLPPELRRYVLSRFLTESATLDRILKIAHTLDGTSVADGNVPTRTADRAQIDALVESMAEGHIAEAAQSLAAIAGICQANAERIISDPAGEPLTIAMKALGLSRTQFGALAETLNDAPAAPLRAQGRIGELKVLFDSLSFTKARVLLTYWDWAAEQSGPYSNESE